MSEQAKEPSANEARAALVECVLDSSYKWCTLGIALAVPVGVRLKSYAPLMYFGMSGTLMDFLNGSASAATGYCAPPMDGRGPHAPSPSAQRARPKSAAAAVTFPSPPSSTPPAAVQV
eukprot:jgi/Tetstr1/438455/TSEL_027010.t1